jgi:hypothetical protein
LITHVVPASPSPGVAAGVSRHEVSRGSASTATSPTLTFRPATRLTSTRSSGLKAGSMLPPTTRTTTNSRRVTPRAASSAAATASVSGIQALMPRDASGCVQKKPRLSICQVVVDFRLIRG